VKNHERVVAYAYSSLRSDFGNLESMFSTMKKEKVESENVEHDKAQRFHQQLRMKLHGLHREWEKSIGELGRQCLD
jgi:hypothetical protein